MQKWEYCSLGPMVQKAGVPVKIKGKKLCLTLYKENAPDIQKIPKDEAKEVPLMIARLGGDGWEMAGCGNLDNMPGYVLYFKRPFRGAEGNEQGPFENPYKLSELERQMINLIIQGKTNAMIGTSLGLSEARVDHSIRDIYSKLGVSSRIEMAVKAVRDHMV